MLDLVSDFDAHIRCLSTMQASQHGHIKRDCLLFIDGRVANGVEVTVSETLPSAFRGDNIREGVRNTSNTHAERDQEGNSEDRTLCYYWSWAVID